MPKTNFRVLLSQEQTSPPAEEREPEAGPKPQTQQIETTAPVISDTGRI